jgi:hypothetical protein
MRFEKAALVLLALAISACSAARNDASTDDEETETEAVRGGCGIERWSVKTGTDPGVGTVDLAHPIDSSIGFLTAIPVRTAAFATTRVAPTENTVFVLRDVTLSGYKREADNDDHLILKDASGRTMIAEIPDPACVSGGPFKAAIQSARTAFESHFTPGPKLTVSSQTISIMGVGFLDGVHGQAGVAPDGIELHPVMGICVGAGCTLPGAPSAAVGDAGVDAAPPPSPPPSSGAIKNVFVIVMENHAWSKIAGSASAPYINKTLLVEGAHAENYFNPPGNHPSEPNYLWLEAGGNLGITNDHDPSANHQSTTSHLTTLLEAKGISWKSYQEGISGTSCPLVSSGLYGAKHNPMVFFDDVTNGNSASSAHCIAHVRPATELESDLSSGAVARYNFVTPDLCHDMHGASACTGTDLIAAGDAWLAGVVPKIMASKAYTDGGAIFVTWDESEGGDLPIGMIVLSPNAKPGHASTVHFTHSSTLRTVQTIFGVGPFLRDAASAADLADMFKSFP